MSYTLLLADDSVTTHRVVELTLAEQGVRVVSVSDGQQALERLAAERPDIVLAEIAIGKVSGYEIAAHVTKTPALAGVPVLLMTGAFDTVDEERVKRSGAAGVIVKPFEPGLVIKRVKELLGFRGDDRPAAPAGDRMVPAAEPPPLRPPSGPRGVGPPPARPLDSARPEPVVLRQAQDDAEQSRRVEGLPAPAPRDAHIPVPPAAWDQLREQSGLSADTAHVEAQAGGDDYFNRLDAAFDTLDAQLSGRSSSRPAARPQTRTAPVAAVAAPPPDPAAEEPVFEVDGDWFPPSPGQDPAARSSAASGTAPAAHPASSAPVAPVAPVQDLAPPAPPEPPVPPAPPAPPALVAPVYRTEPGAPSVAGESGESVLMVPGSHVADAFESLLAAEQGEMPHANAPVIEISDEVVERIATRVAEHLTESVLIDTVTHIVSAVTERLVREEIARIRSRAESSKKT